MAEVTVLRYQYRRTPCPAVAKLSTQTMQATFRRLLATSALLQPVLALSPVCSAPYDDCTDALQAALDVRPTRYAAKSQPNGSWPSKFPRKKKSGGE